MPGRSLVAGALLAACAALAAGAWGQEYPSRPVSFIVPFTPGTTPDVLARLLGPQVSQRFGVPVVVENRPGAAGMIGMDSVARSQPDGHTVLFAATAYSTLAAVHPRLPYDPRSGFAPVALLGTTPVTLVVNPYLPVKSLKEFIALVKKRPGELNYASSGIGSVFHLSMELFKSRTGMEVLHVPYKGMSGVTTDLSAGHVQAAMIALQTVTPFVKSGRMRLLAVLGSERAANFPNVPTFAESGFPDMVVHAWYGVMVPGKTPAAAIARLNAELNRALSLPETRKAGEKMGVDLAGGPPSRLDELVRTQIKLWTGVAQRAAIRIE